MLLSLLEALFKNMTQEMMDLFCRSIHVAEKKGSAFFSSSFSPDEKERNENSCTRKS